MINVSLFQTTSKNVQDMIESRLEKRTKGVYVPCGGKLIGDIITKIIFYLVVLLKLTFYHRKIYVDIYG